MDPKIIKLGKKDDIAAVVKKIKDLKEREVVFEVEKGSPLLNSSAEMRLIKRTGEVLGKKILISANDPVGKMLARKAEMSVEARPMRPIAGKTATKPPSGRFSDIITSKKILPIATVQSLNKKASTLIPKLPKLPKVRIGGGWAKRMVFGLAVVVLVLFLLTIILPQASITLYARSEPISRDFEIQVDQGTKEVDHSGFKLPGQVVTKEVSDTKTFVTTGASISGTKASGAVTIQNNTASTLKLRAATTTLVAEGKNFLFTSDVAGIKPNAKTGPVAIVAEKPGDAYNMPAGTRFQIVNAALGNRDVYAQNDAALSNGTSNGVRVLSQQDLDRAASAMTELLVLRMQEDLATQNGSDDLKVLPSGASVEILAKTANKDVNTEAESFDFTMIARIKGLAYKESEVKALISERINSLLSEDKYLLEGKEVVSAKFKSLDLQGGKGILSVHFETIVAYHISDKGLARLLSGKNAEQIKDILLTKPEIDRVDVKFSPFFVNKAPRYNGKIYIQTKLNEN